MLRIWGEDLPATCEHRESPWTCPTCRDARASGAVDTIVAVVLVAALLVVGARAVRLESAAEQEQLQRHLQRLEDAHPGALQRLQELAAEQRRRVRP